MKFKYSIDKLKEAVKDSVSIREVLIRLGLKPAGGNYMTMKKLFKENNIDTTHFLGQGHKKAIKFLRRKSFSLEEILTENSFYSSNDLRERLIKSNIKEKKCEICGLEKWNDKDIPLELHHKNGDRTDNRIENLQIVCPNCHAQTSSYRRMKRLIEKDKDEIKKDYDEIVNNRTKEKEIKKKKEKKKSICLGCGKTFDGNRKYCSIECYREATKGKRPSVIALLSDFKELKTFTAIGRKYNVSDNAVKKWCVFYGILDIIK